MAYTTFKPTGLSIKRSGASFLVSWKIGDKDYGEGQNLQYKLDNGKWIDVPVNGSTTNRNITVDTSKYFPNTKRPSARFT
jgi:hypothetical protein